MYTQSETMLHTGEYTGFICMSMYGHLSVCIYVYVTKNTQARTYIRSYVHVCTCVHVWTFEYVYICTYVTKNTHARTYIHTYMYIHMLIKYISYML